MNNQPFCSPCWYALKTKSRHEFSVSNLLLACNFEIYLPVVEKIRQWHDRKKCINFPLFPGYLFIKCPMDKVNYYEILNTKGVVYVVGNKWPALSRIPEQQISSIKLAQESKLPVNVVSTLEKGDLVRVSSGLLEGIVGTLVRKTKSEVCIVIAIDSLNRGLQVEVDCRQCEIEKI